MELHASEEKYLKAIRVLQKQKGMVCSVDVARHMKVSKPSVCHAMATQQEGSFLIMDEELFLHRTDVGGKLPKNLQVSLFLYRSTYCYCC